jgi:hypothetical protein
VRTGIASDEGKAHRVGWPGFSSVFEVDWPAHPLARLTIDAVSVLNAIRRENRHEGVHEAVGIFEKAICQYLESEEAHPDLWFVVIEEEVFRLGRPEQIVPVENRTPSQLPMSNKDARRTLAGGSNLLFPQWQAEADATIAVEAYEVNFHNQLKARMLKHRVVIQILRETTIAPEDFLNVSGRPRRRVDDPATIAWNLCTTAFFKAQGRPWQLHSVRPGVCYVGLVFKQLHAPTADANACCGAQMFLDSGDGVVFKGVEGNWYKAERKECHISKERASELMSTVVAAYAEKHGSPPLELFIHGRTRFDQAEWDGFQAAAPSATRLAGIRIRRSMDTRLYRESGRTPLLRGIAMILGKRRALLWTRGYVPRLETYPGWEVPAPLDIEVSRGDCEIEQVLIDVLGLTKLNYNACIYADGMPVTLRFANAVGEILTAVPGTDYRPQPFRYYV